MLEFKDVMHKIDELLYYNDVLQHGEYVKNKYLLLDISTYIQLITEAKSLVIKKLVIKKDEITKESVDYYQGYILYPVYVNYTFIHVTSDNNTVYDELTED